MAESIKVDENVKENESKKVEVKIDPDLQFIEQGGRKLYESTQEEFDDCFYQVLALGSFVKTFTIGSKLELTFMTISQNERMQLYDELQKWGESTKLSKAMFEIETKKRELSHYLTSLSIDGNLINLREGKPEDRLSMLSGMADQAIDYYSLYLWVFLELVRRSLMAKNALKNS